jgi:thiamine-phosphate pyrophosphorylase
VRRELAGLYAITPDEPCTDILVRKVGLALRGGASVVQYRNKTAVQALRIEQARALADLCRAVGTAFIVNDDIGLALELGADGVHLGAEDGNLAEARRRLGPDKLLGASCYNRVDLARNAVEAGADYLAFGSVFSSVTKPGAVRASLQIFSEARRSIALPLVAIGGISLQNAAQAFAAGADAVAVISALFDADDIAERATGFTRLYQQLRMQQ